jgi:type II secretory pathway pseudopilin PulG
MMRRTPTTPSTKQRSRTSEQGYILLTLMLMCSLILIGLAAVAPQISQQLKRDREEELIHRGVQYSRAIRKFYKKNGRYPVRLEELEKANNLRYLRQRYKDPVTGEDFKLLHFGEVQMFTGGGIAGALPPGVPVAALAGALGGNQQAGGANNAQMQAMASQVQNQMIAQTAMMSGAGAAGMNSAAPGGALGTGPGGTGSTSPFSTSASGPGGQTFGGGPIVGVVSTSKKESIRQFNKKNHYKDWQFIYDPGTDRGGLLNTPAQPPLKQPGAAQGQGQPGVPGQPGTGLGGLQGNPMQPSQGLNPSPQPPPATPPQQ